MHSMPKSARPTAALCRSLRGSLLILSMVVAAACGDRAAKQAAADSALVKDLALANQQTPVPTFQDTTVAPAPAPATRAKEEPPAPVRTKAAPTHTPPPVQQQVSHAPPPQPVQQPVPAPVVQTPAPAPAAMPAEIGAGSGGTLTSGSKVCTSTNLPGDKLVATLNNAVTGTNGAVIPAGSNVVLEVASASAGQNGQAPQIGFRIRAIVVNDQTYAVSGSVITLDSLQRTKVAAVDPNADKKKVIGGAIAGAILGQMIGHSTKGTVIGAAAGAAAGAAISKSGEKWEGCLPAGAALRVTLNEPIVM